MKTALLKTIVFSLILLSAGISQAQSNNYRQLTKAESENLAQAIKIAMADQDYFSKDERDCSPQDSLEAIKGMTSAQVNINSAQPLFIIEKIIKAYHETRKNVLVLETSSDFKLVTKYKLSYYVLRDINKGDLLNPNIVPEWNLSLSFSCFLKETK